mgnify:CR=1 FL=1
MKILTPKEGIVLGKRYKIRVEGNFSGNLDVFKMAEAVGTKIQDDLDEKASKNGHPDIQTGDKGFWLQRIDAYFSKPDGTRLESRYLTSARAFVLVVEYYLQDEFDNLYSEDRKFWKTAQSARGE